MTLQKEKVGNPFEQFSVRAEGFGKVVETKHNPNRTSPTTMKKVENLQKEYFNLFIKNTIVFE